MPKTFETLDDCSRHIQRFQADLIKIREKLSDLAEEHGDHNAETQYYLKEIYGEDQDRPEMFCVLHRLISDSWDAAFKIQYLKQQLGWGRLEMMGHDFGDGLVEWEGRIMDRIRSSSAILSEMTGST